MRVCVHTPLSEENYSFKGEQKRTGDFKGIGNKLSMCCSYLYRFFLLFFFNSGPVRPFSRTGFEAMFTFCSLGWLSDLFL